MHFEPHSVPLKDGRTALFRAPRREDGPAMLEDMRIVCGETPFLSRTPEDWDGMTEEKEAAFLQSTAENPNRLMIVCEVDGELAGNCDIAFSTLIKSRHIAKIGIALKKKFWNLGIGTAMFARMEREARGREGVQMMELMFIEGNSRARALYEKAGFSVVGVRPNSVRLDSGLVNEYIMQKIL